MVPTAAYRSRPSELRAKAKSRTWCPRAHMDGPWTNFYELTYHMEHLTEEQYMEAWNIMEQDPPFEHPPRNFFEEAFWNEEIYKPERQKMQQEADLKRWERLVELGVVSTEGDEIYDWELPQEDPTL